MTAALVQSLGHGQDGTSTSTVISVSSLTVTAGNTIFVVGGYYAAAGTETVVDSLGNTYTRIERKKYGGTCTLWAAPVTVGGTLTSITFGHPTSNYNGVVAAEFSGVGALYAIGAASGATSTTATWLPSATIPANGLAVGGALHTTNSGEAFTIGGASGSPSTTEYISDQTTDWLRVALAYAPAGASEVTGFVGTMTQPAARDWAGASGTYSGAGTNAPAGLATGTGTANDNPAGTGVAAATGTAHDVMVLLPGYYCEPSGSDSTGDGSADNPWRTYIPFYAVAVAGDICYARDGTYTAVPGMAVQSLSGTEAAPITLRAYPGETPVFVGTGVRVGAAISFQYCSWHVVDGLQFENFNCYDNAIIWHGQGQVGLSEHNTVRNCKFTLFNGSDPSVLTSHGIYLSGANNYTTIEDNIFIGRTASEGGSGILCYHHDYFGGVGATNWIVQRNIFLGFGGRGALHVNEASATGQILHNTFVGNTGRNLDLRSYSTLVIRDNASDDPLATMIYDGPMKATNQIAPSASDHNFPDQTFTADYYLTLDSTGRNAASDGLDAGALNWPDCYADAGVAQGSGTAWLGFTLPTMSPLLADAGLAIATGAAYQPSVTIVESQTQVYAGLATGTGAAYVPPFARLGIPTVLVAVDFARDGSFATAGDDITADVLSDSLTWTRGRSADFSAEATGEARFTVRNDDDRYTTTDFLPGMPVHISATYSGVTYPLFFGYIERVAPDPVSRTIGITCYDVLRKMGETDAVFAVGSLISWSARDFRVALLEEFDRNETGPVNMATNGDFSYGTSGWNDTQYPGTSGHTFSVAAGGGGDPGPHVATWTTSQYAALIYSLDGDSLYVAGTTYTASVWMKVAAGSKTIRLMFGHDTGGQHSTSLDCDLTTSWQKFAVRFPVAQTVTSSQVTVEYATPMVTIYDMEATGATVYVAACSVVKGSYGRTPSASARRPNLVGNSTFEGGGLNGWRNGFSNVVTNPIPTSTTGYSGAANSWHGFAGLNYDAVMPSIYANAGGIHWACSGTFRAGVAYVFAFRAYSAGYPLSYALGSNGTPTDAETESNVYNSSWTNYYLTWTPTADRTDVHASVWGTWVYLNSVFVGEYDGSLSYAYPNYLCRVVLPNVTHAPASEAVSTTAYRGGRSLSWVSQPLVGSGEFYQFNHVGSRFLPGVTYSISLWLRASTGMPYVVGIAQASTYWATWTDHTSTSGLIPAETWTNVTLTWTPTTEAVNYPGATSTPDPGVFAGTILYIAQNDAIARTVYVDQVRVIVGSAPDDDELPQWRLDDETDEVYSTAPVAGNTVLSGLTTLNGATLTRHWIEPSASAPYWTYVSEDRTTLTTKTSAETYDDDLNDMTAAEIDREAIINYAVVNSGAGDTYIADETSIGQYGLRPTTVSAGIVTEAAAEAVGTALVTRYKNPRARPKITVVNRFPSQLQRELDDLITINFARLGIVAGTYLIAAMTTTIAREGNWWSTEYTLEAYA